MLTHFVTVGANPVGIEGRIVGHAQYKINQGFVFASSRMP